MGSPVSESPMYAGHLRLSGTRRTGGRAPYHASRQPTRLNLAVMYRARWKTSSGIPMEGG